MLYVFTSTTRANNFRRHTQRTRWPAGVSVAVTATDQHGPTLSLAERVWQPLDTDRRQRLVELGELR